MEEIKTEPVDFVKEFQEYLSQQTQHVNMISGSVCGEKEAAEPYSSNVHASQDVEQNGVEAPSVEVSLSLGEGSDVHMEGLERTCDGKYKCSYCSYANKGMTRLVEHIRMHTGEKPHRCQLCPFASAYERHLEAHMRSHTGEKPYKCDLCAFRCSDRSNLSHHRRRRHKLLPTRVTRPPFTNKRVLGALQKRTGSLGFGRRLLVNFNPASSDYVQDFSHKLPHHEFRNLSKSDENDNHSPVCNGLSFNNPLDQLSTLAGQVSDLTPDSQTPEDEKPILIQQISGAMCSSSVQTSPKRESPMYLNCSPTPGISFENNINSDSQPNSPATEQQLFHKCHHCDVHFTDNILFTVHMGCHGFERPFQCNVCGHLCSDKYDFACHFARGQHTK